MKLIKIRSISFLLTIVMLFGVVLTSCGPLGELFPEVTTTPEHIIHPDVPGDEYTLEKEEGHNQLTFYWNYSEGYENCDIWIWWGDKAGSGYTFHPCSYGAKVVVNVPEGISEVGFIVRRDCSEPGGTSWGNATKDFADDRFAVIEGEETFIWLKSGDGSQYTSTDGGKTLQMIKKFTLAGITDINKIKYNLTPKVKLTDISQVKVYEGEREIAISAVSSIGKSATSGTITLSEDLDISKTYTVKIEGYGDKAAMPTAIFDSEYFKTNFHYDGDDLGATVSGDSTTFKVWAPTATKVVLDLYSAGNGGEAYKNVEMIRGERGVWSHTEPCGHGTYYTYTVTTSAGTQTATDPYAKSAGLNGDRSMVIDLSQTDPEGWAADASFASGIEHYNDAVIWEVHVRDFSNKIASSQYRGKYLAFTEKGLVNEAGVPVGIDYLKELGITHVHLLPIYDYATVNEAEPDSEFNWGYDPKNYNVPEGSYSTDPYNGEVRVRELKQAIMGLHEAGIGVIMDVVYNHTYDANSSFNKIVPYYYYRYTSTGANSSASGCGNDTASERYMYGKFMNESIEYWLTEYNLDGFRFDLMGLHDLETMKEIEATVHAIDPKALIYGEGWTMGSTITGEAQANQSNISQIEATNGAAGSVAVFNDAIRDGLKGSVFDKTVGGYINGNANASQMSVAFGITGASGVGKGWTVKDAMVINYMSAHDNHTLWDKLELTCPDATEEEKLAMNRLGAAIIAISQGTPFMQAGEEMLRTKDGDENSYKSSDEINNIDWEALTPDSAAYGMMQYYKGLFAMRAQYDIFTAGSDVKAKVTELGGGVMAVRYEAEDGETAIVMINPSKGTASYSLDGEYKLVVNGTQAGTEAIETASGNISVPPCSVLVYVQ